MKRVLSIILCLGILLSLILPASGAAGSGSPMTLGTTPQGAVSVDTDRLARLASGRRSAVEDNMVFPGPLVEKCSFTPGYNEEIPLGYYATGKPNQYMCMAIYFGKEAAGDPIAWDYAPFDMEPGLGTYKLTWKKGNISTGRYTLLTFTAVEKNNELFAIDGTVFSTDIYVYDKYEQRWNGFVMEPDTWEELDTIRLPYGETTVLAAGRSPLPSDGTDKVSLKSSIFRSEEAGGYFFLTPFYTGNDRAVFYYGEGMEYIPVEVCLSDEGHSYSDPYSAATATENHKGYTLQACQYCETVLRNEISSYCANFEGFKDISKDAWYYDTVKKAVGRNLFNGINTTTFAPDRAMNRAMLVTVLWRFEGEPDAPTADFTDVKSKDWYAKAVNWAADTGIVNGVGKGRFNPEGNVTREQFATILYRYAQFKGLDVADSVYPMTYPDQAEVNSWADDAMAWATGKELITGIGKNGKSYLTPQGNATRAQVATVLIRFLENILETPQYPDVSTALDSGLIQSTVTGENILWAYYEGGILEIGGKGNPAEMYDGIVMPWSQYIPQITEIRFLSGTHTVWGIFREYPALETLVLADSVKVIADNAFYKCPALKNIRFSANLTAIGENAFCQCQALETVILCNGAPTSIGQYAFADNESLVTVELGNNIRSIGAQAFRKCTALQHIVLPDSLLDFEGMYANTWNDAIGTKAFYGCSSLESVVLPVGLRHLASHVFYGCTALKNVSMPLALEEMDTGIFRNCTSLEELVLPPSLIKLKTGCFMGCTGLKDLYFYTEFLSTYKTNVSDDTEEDALPFGNPDQVVVYAFLGSNIAEKARDLGHKVVYIF